MKYLWSATALYIALSAPAAMAQSEDANGNGTKTTAPARLVLPSYRFSVEKMSREAKYDPTVKCDLCMPKYEKTPGTKHNLDDEYIFMGEKLDTRPIRLFGIPFSTSRRYDNTVAHGVVRKIRDKFFNLFTEGKK